MRNQEERNSFIDNPQNWHEARIGHALMKMSHITYKGETRYKLEVYQKNFHWYAGVQKEGYKAEWTLKSYYKLDGACCAMEPQSLTQMREWIADLDKKYPDKASRSALPKTMDIPRRRHGKE